MAWDNFCASVKRSVQLNEALLRPRHPLKTIEQIIADMPGAKMFTILDAKCGFWQMPLDEASSK